MLFRSEKTIKRCIDSIARQTYSVFEIIVVDDGSTDRTLDIVQGEYGNKVTIIRQKHGGAQAARNAGIRAAKGEYIAFLDSDDEWLPDKIELQIQELYKNGDVVVYGNGYIQTDWENDVPLVYREPRSRRKNAKIGKRTLLKMDGKNGNIYKTALKGPIGDFDSILVSKKSLMDIGLLDEKLPSFQEWDLMIRLAQKKRFIFIRKPVFVYHLHDGETISKSLKKSIDGMEYICEKYKYEIMSQLGKKELVQRYKDLMGKCLSYKDRRVVLYFLKYKAGKMGIFFFK